MASLPKFTCPVGTRAVCSMCHEVIEWNGVYWNHPSGNVWRHITIPTANTMPPQESARAAEAENGEDWTIKANRNYMQDIGNVFSRMREGQI